MNAIQLLAVKAAGLDLTHAFQTGGEEAVEGLGGTQGMSRGKGGLTGGGERNVPKPQAKAPAAAGGAFDRGAMAEALAPQSTTVGASKALPGLESANIGGPAASKAGPWEEASRFKGKPTGGLLSAAPEAEKGLLTSTRGILAKGQRAIGRGLRAAPGLSRIPSSLGRRGAVAGAATAGTLGLGALLRGMGGDGASGAGVAQAPAAAPAVAPAAAPAAAAAKPSAMPSAAGGDGAQTASIGGGVMDWIKANPGKAALLGLIPAGAYGLTKLMGGRKKKEDKEAGDYLGDLPRNSTEFRKMAADVIKHNSVIITSRYLEKQASDAHGKMRRAMLDMQAALLATGNVYKAASVAFPGLRPKARATLAQTVVKQAWAMFSKQACGSMCGQSPKKSSSKSFHGKPARGTRGCRRTPRRE